MSLSTSWYWPSISLLCARTYHDANCHFLLTICLSRASTVHIKGEPAGLLSGKRIAIKDNIFIAGTPLQNGSKVWSGYTPEFDATVVTRILQEGELSAHVALSHMLIMTKIFKSFFSHHHLTCKQTSPSYLQANVTILPTSKRHHLTCKQTHHLTLQQLD